MNVDSRNDSPSLRSCEVTSKYFSTKSGMDESLSDFQEKKNFAPKKTEKVEKAGTSKPKRKNNIKKIRGQKDIRTVLKKNELVAYSSDFDKICKQSGIDIDPEQLQLAIALSKSLQQSEAKDDGSPSSSGTLTTQERSGKIRTTLKEYGFVVPEIKITKTKKKKVKKNRKDYKLLLTSETEKQQIISDRYSQVLFQNLENTALSNNISNPTNTTAELYYKVTNIPYTEIKDNNLLYVENLLEKSPSFVGCLLKNWAEIPGRPKSPIFERPKFKFENIDFLQVELDIILSGSLKSAQEIANNKYNLLPVENLVKTTVHSTKKEISEIDIEKDIKMNFNCIEIVEDEVPIRKKLLTEDLNSKDITIRVLDVENSNLLTITQNIRSCSPDIFDDDSSEIMNNTHNEEIQKQKNKSVTKPSLCVMELTECVNSQSIIQKPIYQLSQDSTKRKTNDFMDVTECVVGSSQPIREHNIIEENIDLTQTSDSEDEAKGTIKDKDAQNSQSMDLTQSSDTSADLPDVRISGKDDMDDTIILNESYSKYQNNVGFLENNMNHNIITQRLNIRNESSDTQNCLVHEKGPIIIESEDEENNQSEILNNTLERRAVNSIELTSVNHKLDIKDTNNVTEKSSVKYQSTHIDLVVNKETVESEDEGEDSHIKKPDINLGGRAISPIDFITPANHNLEIISRLEIHNSSKDNLDLTDEHPKLPEKSVRSDYCKSKTESFFEEFIHQHSENSNEDTGDTLHVQETSNTSLVIEKESSSMSKNEDIDLTQESDTSESSKGKDTMDSPKILSEVNNLGKIGNVSIDYDEVFDDMRSFASSKSHSKSISPNLYSSDNDNENLQKPSNSDLVSNTSQNSEVFEISDKELDYSMQKSKLFEIPKDNFDFGGISVVDNLPDLPSFRPSTESDNVGNRSLGKSMSESCLPQVDINKRNENEKQLKSCSSVSVTPEKLRKDVVAKTPKNGEYSIKTDQVTPMLDYERMTTPERNAELDKYGLKPFKRKRAIQLLTHLYNQTHPIVESLEDLSSPSKRFKPNSTLSQSPTKRKSPKKLSLNKKSEKVSLNSSREEVNDVEAVNKENDIYEVTSEVPVIRDMGCSEEDWVFQKREKAKVHSCRVPLHVAFHNYVSSRQRLYEAILRYEPVNIDIIHKGLVTNGFKYDPKDLLKFMDKRCITVKTADNSGRNKKHY